MFRKKNPKPPDSWLNFERCRYSPEQTVNAARLLDEANALGALADEQILSLFRALRTNPGDAYVANLIEDALQPYRIRNVLEPDPWRPYPGPETDLDVGEVEIGVIKETGLPWRLRLADFPFTAIVGPTGFGKTSLLFGILECIS